VCSSRSAMGQVVVTRPSPPPNAPHRPGDSPVRAPRLKGHSGRNPALALPGLCIDREAAGFRSMAGLGGRGAAFAANRALLAKGQHKPGPIAVGLRQVPPESTASPRAPRGRLRRTRDQAARWQQGDRRRGLGNQPSTAAAAPVRGRLSPRLMHKRLAAQPGLLDRV